VIEGASELTYLVGSLARHARSELTGREPPRGSGRVRLVEIEGIDLQPCGGTHVRRTGEIGRVAVIDIEKKGKQNRRVRIALA
jgi:Ser-tRNA(Ala) deacylase AlaX